METMQQEQQNSNLEYRWCWLGVSAGNLSGEDETDCIMDGIADGLGLPLILEQSEEWYPSEIYCLRQGLEIRNDLVVPFGYTPYLLLNVQTPYATYESRLDTFKQWPKYMTPRPDELAAAGFYYQGPSDRVTCYCCKVRLLNWKPTDVPIDEHMRYSPNCPLVNSVCDMC